jgi:hypothetical protein
MPQLDLGIFVLEIFINFLFFWYIYVYKAQYIFSYLMKIIKFRICKLKIYNIKIWYFIFKLSIIIKFKKLNNNNFYNILLSILMNYVIINNRIQLVLIKKYYTKIYNILIKLLYNFNIKYINNQLIKIN